MITRTLTAGQLRAALADCGDDEPVFAALDGGGRPICTLKHVTLTYADRDDTGLRLSPLTVLELGEWGTVAEFAAEGKAA